MSNNDDFDFNRDDLFDDDFGDDDSGGDDFGSDDFDFGDDSDDFNIDDDDFSSDLDSALGGDDDDFGGGDDDFATTESAGGGGTSRGFVIAAVLMVILFLVGIGLIVFILMQPDQATLDFEASKAAIETQNAIAQTDIAASSTAAIENATATEVANIANATATQQAIEELTAAFTPPTETPTEDLAATEAQLTADAQGTADAASTQVALDATNTAISFQLTLNPSFEPPTQEILATETPQGEASEEVLGGGSPVPISAVQQTATALAQLFAATPTTSGAVPTNVITDNGTPVVIGGSTEQPGQGGGDNNGELPETGLFDDIFQGNPTFIFLAAFGLLGVIVVSRSVRKSKRDD